jgi:hypothetical protein
MGVGAKMRRLILSGAVAALALLSIPAHADTPDPAPTLSTNAVAHATIVSGPHHLNKVAFNLNVTDWWLTGSVTDGVAGDPQLIVDAHMVSWALLEKATDATGAPLKVTPLLREPSPLYPRKVLERVAITLPRALADTARRDGLTVTVSGTKLVAGATRAFPIAVPAQAMAAFLDGYAAVASHPAPTADMAPATVPPLPPAPQAPTAPSPSPVSRSALVDTPIPEASPPPPTPAPVASTTPPTLIRQAPAPPIRPAPGIAPDDDDPAITPVPDKRIRQPDVPPVAAAATATPSASPAPQPIPQIPPLPPQQFRSLPGAATLDDTIMPADAAPSSTDGGGAGEAGTWVPSLGLQFVPTSSGAMVLLAKPGSIAASRGIESGDFIESVDGVTVKGLSGADMAAKIAGAKVIHMIAAGDIKVR